MEFLFKKRNKIKCTNNSFLNILDICISQKVGGLKIGDRISMVIILKELRDDRIHETNMFRALNWKSMGHEM